MKPWKRNAAIAYLACSLAVAVLFLVFGFAVDVPGVVKFLFAVLAAVVVAGVAVGVYVVAAALLHERATLHAGPEGVINIERSALESTARRALGSIQTIALQGVVARVIETKADPVIDLTVTAVPFGEESLMVTAGRIQTAAKRAVEAFTDHEVRYVAVNFVEPKTRKHETAAAGADEARAASAYTPPRYSASKGSVCVDEAAETSSGEPKPSVWSRVKDKVASARSAAARPDEDVVETVAVVEDVSFSDETPCSDAEAAARDGAPVGFADAPGCVEEAAAVALEPEAAGVQGVEDALGAQVDEATPEGAFEPVDSAVVKDKAREA